MDGYLIGYGSLIHPDERAALGLPRQAETVRLRGYRRRWNVKAANKKTYLGVESCASSSLNGVLFPVNEERLGRLDAREGAYDRLNVSVTDLSSEVPSTARVWMYVPRREWISGVASPAFAVKRGYVDTVIAGCLRYGETFCREFIATTDLWEQPWFDNRRLAPADRERIDTLVGLFYPAATQVLTRLPSRPPVPARKER